MLGTLLDAAKAQSYLARTLPLFRDRRGPSLPRLTVRDVLIRDGWVVVYRLAEPQPNTAERLPRFVIVQHFSNGDFDRAAARIRRQARVTSEWDPIVGRFVAERPDQKILIYPFPLDTKIPYLHEAASPMAVRERFHAKGGSLLNGIAPVQACRVEAVRHVPMRRCQLRYEFEGTARRRLSVYGKTFRGGRGKKLYDSMVKVSALFERQGDPSLVTPRPLAYLPDWRMVVQESAPGVTLCQMIQEGLARDEHMAAAARAIAVLHAGSLDLETNHLSADEVGLISTSYRRLAVLGYHDSTLGSTLRKIRHFANELTPGALVPVHRDFYDKQLLIAGPQTALIDLDSLTLGSPEIDLANFGAHLLLRDLQKQTSQARHSRLRAFFDEYVRHAAQPLDTSRLCFFLATTYFRLACKYRLWPGGFLMARMLRNHADTALNPQSWPSSKGEVPR